MAGSPETNYARLCLAPGRTHGVTGEYALRHPVPRTAPLYSSLRLNSRAALPPKIAARCDSLSATVAIT